MSARFVFALGLLMAATIPATPAVAQIDRDEQVLSLEHVREFGLVVDVEMSGQLRTSPTIAVPRLRALLADRLESMTARRPSMDPLHADHPYLYVHVNAHDAGDGLVPFAVSAAFIQQARLSAGGRRMPAATWESGFVGIVSYDRIGGIADAAVRVVEEFAVDLVAATGGS